MNKIQRRLFRAFLDSGGNITDEVELERFVRYVEAVLSLLPPKLRLAVDLAWRASDSSPYVRVARILSQREGGQVSPQALRQRVALGELNGAASYVDKVAIAMRLLGDAEARVLRAAIDSHHSHRGSSLLRV